jgi:nucleotide-binding universal stress UspA family protein
MLFITSSYHVYDICQLLLVKLPKYKILVPLDGSERSIRSLGWVKRFFKIKDVQITLLNVIHLVYQSELDMVELDVAYEIEAASNRSAEILNEPASRLENYEISKLSIYGFAADTIIREAIDGKYDFVIMTKSSTTGIAKFIGSVTAKVVRDSQVSVVIVP